MDEDSMIHQPINRRALPRQLAFLTASGALPLAVTPPAQPADDPPKTDRDFVIAAGMTPDEADCWTAIAEAAAKFFQLPELHPMDRQEVASAIHIVQNKLLSRPTYRKYLELAKAAAGK